MKKNSSVNIKKIEVGSLYRSTHTLLLSPYRRRVTYPYVDLNEDEVVFTLKYNKDKVIFMDKLGNVLCEQDSCFLAWFSLL